MRWVRRVGVLVVVLLLTVITAGPALAAPTKPNCPVSSPACGIHRHWWDWLSLTGKKSVQVGLPDCKTAPTPQMPGSGLSGYIDPGPTTYNPASTGLYGVSQYMPPLSTYDVGCADQVASQANSAEWLTQLANMEFGAATMVVAAASSLHRAVSPPTFLTKLDPLLVQLSSQIRAALFDPYIGIGLVVVGILLLFAARKKSLPDALERFAQCFAVLVLAVGLLDYPVVVAHWFAGTVTSFNAGINAEVVGKPAPGEDPSTGRAELLTTNVLYNNWCRAEFGSDTSPVARQNCRPLLANTTFTYTERAQIAADPSKAASIASTKEHNFRAIAAAVHDQDPDAYGYLTGHRGPQRLGFGLLAVVMAVATCTFMVAADLLVLILLLLLLGLVIVVPGLAPLMLHSRKLLLGVLSLGGAGLLNESLFTVGAAANVRAVGYLLGSDVGIPEWLSLVLCGVVTIGLWRALKPLRSLTRMPSSAGIGAAATRRPRVPGWDMALGAAGGVAGWAASEHSERDLDQGHAADVNYDPGTEPRDEVPPASDDSVPDHEELDGPDSDPVDRSEWADPGPSINPEPVRDVDSEAEPSADSTSPDSIESAEREPAAHPFAFQGAMDDPDDRSEAPSAPEPDVVHYEPMVVDGVEVRRLWDSRTGTYRTVPMDATAE